MYCLRLPCFPYRLSAASISILDLLLLRLFLFCRHFYCFISGPFPSLPPP
ncbi:hypothetical protein ASPCADRAFT_205035 [Aspergillus carbonarius ITEM 5010]|uniref:Uncharacterized protein n=1 Tax=Aspergillus carbonarius (strain ITEM 5010) TaxID=602072 RepID=A0A1R3RTI3_ASPC5|nr:hypothetical protein ASPCADRAFT_205035 [Aspergillus carbonarius ITEM 5010]